MRKDEQVIAIYSVSNSVEICKNIFVVFWGLWEYFTNCKVG